MATTPVTLETTAQTLAAELALVWGAKLGGAAELTPAAGATETGWLITVTTAGSANGQVVVWFQAAGAAAAIGAGLKLDPAPKDDAVSALLCDVVTGAAQALIDKSALEHVSLSPAVAVQGVAPPDAAAFDLAIGGKACPVQVLVTLAPAGVAAAAAPSNSRRLEAVLDVDLPLVVRFGRAVMPLRALAVLGPGSVIDMGRSPDELVELLVGERVIARGEVVIVGGNYGVRITTLTGSQLPEGQTEARA
jgi:flagellar motor switch protein FliN/FliY